MSSKKGTERRPPAPSRWAGSDTRPRGARFPPLVPGSANTGPEAARFAARQLCAASVLRKPPRCRLRAGLSDARAVIVFYIHQCLRARQPAWSRASQGCPGEGMATAGEKGWVLQHRLAPEVGTARCRREENLLCSSSLSQSVPCVL